MFVAEDDVVKDGHRYSLVLSCTHHGKTRVGKIRLFVVLRMGYDSILVFYLFSYLFVQDLPVQGNPV